jgi:flavin reductase (DIM6/NTAB) family NADH-FMN oxidoreductase RutF
MKKSFGAKTMVYPTLVWVIGSYNSAGQANASVAAWVGICSSNPPAVAVSFRKERASYDNIMEHKAFTVNIASEEYAAQTDYFGTVSGKNTDKFAETGLTPVKSDLVDAPYVEEFPLILECRLLKYTELGSHTQFIGEIMDVKVDESVLGDDGVPSMEKLRPFVFAPGNGGYYGTGRYIGKAYAIGIKPKRGV